MRYPGNPYNIFDNNKKSLWIIRVVACIEAILIISSLFIFFIIIYKKISRAQKALKRKQAPFTPLEVFARLKNAATVVFCSLVFILLVNFRFVSVFVCAKSFCKKRKINKQAWNCLDCLNTHCYWRVPLSPPQPTHQEFSRILRTYFYF